jgi:PAS domain S-box-containing protein
VVYWIFYAYAYSLTIAGFAMLVKTTIESPKSYRKQGLIMVLAGLVPLMTSTLDELGLLKNILADPTPIGFAISVALCWWGLFRFGILEIVPVARGLLLDSIDDGMLVVDLRERILDINRAAQTFLAGLTERSIGLAAETEIRDWAKLRAGWKPEESSGQEVSLEKGGQTIMLEVRVTPLTGYKGQVTGYLLLLHDITEKNHAEVEKEKLITELRAALGQVKTLSGLLPICCSCKKIRDKQDHWHSLDRYLTEHTEAVLTHGLCPDCAKKLYPELGDCT